MFVLIFYILPAFCFGLLLSFWLRFGLAHVLGWLPEGVVLALSGVSTFMLIAGVVVAVLGHVANQWEVVSHKYCPKNLDAIAIYSGAVLVCMSFLLSPEWFGWLGLFATTVIISSHLGTLTVRLMVEFTDTADKSLMALLVYVSVISLFGWLTWVVL